MLGLHLVYQPQHQILILMLLVTQPCRRILLHVSLHCEIGRGEGGTSQILQQSKHAHCMHSGHQGCGVWWGGQKAVTPCSRGLGIS